MLVVFVFLNSWRSTVITGLALPVSVLASFVAVWAFGFTLNTMSLLGLSLAIGILIDDAIVVRENIVRHVEMGKTHYQAALEGTSEIGMAVTATTLSIVVVFIPVAFMPGIAGQWFKPFGLTIACSVLVSLFVSFSLDPMLSAYWPDPHMALERRPLLSRLLGRFNLWFDRRADNYKGVIAWALDHRLAMVGLALAAFWGALAIPYYGLVGSQFAPDIDESEFILTLDTPPGSNLEYTRRKARGSQPDHPQAARGPLRLQRRRRPGRSGRRRHHLRQADAEDRADAQAGRRHRRHPYRPGQRCPASRRSITTGFGEPGEKQIALQLQGPDAGELTATGGADAGAGADGARCRRRRPVDQGPEARARRPGRSRAGRFARHHRRRRWRRRCGRRLPASTPATGSIRPARRGT